MKIPSKFRRAVTALASCLALTVLGSAPPALAQTVVPAVNPSTSGVFELDGNTTHESTNDWNDVAAGTLTGNVSGNTGIVLDTVGNLFTQGSKDTLDVSQWSYTVQSSPPKADIQAAYALRYSVPNSASGGSDSIVYFGSDRGTTNGTTFSGYWFFQNQITLGTPKANGTGKFVGTHKAGDVLVAAAYDNGGHVGSIVIFQWQGGDGTAGHLQQVFSIGNPINSAGLLCDLAVGGTDSVCGETNSTDLTGTIPWRTGTLSPGIFFEGGIDFSALFQSSVPCFASFLATTRSSTSATAEIKNFVLHNFQPCTASISTQIKNSSGTNITGTTVVGGTVVHDTATLNLGGSSATPTGTVTYTRYDNSTCTAPAASTETLPLNADGTVPPSSNFTTQPGANISYSASYSGDNNFPPATLPSTDCEPLTVAELPTLVVTDVRSGSALGASILNTAVDTSSATVNAVDVATVSATIPSGLSCTNAPSFTGTVTFSRYTTADCSGTAATETVSVGVTSCSGGIATAQASSSAFALTQGSSTFLCFQAIYNGDAAYDKSGVSKNEPLCAFKEVK